MMSRQFLASSVLALLLLWPGLVQAKETPQPKFLTPAQYDPAQLLPPPPADGSASAKAELAELHQIESARTPEALAHAKADDTIEDGSIFADAMGAGFDLKALPATAALLGDVRIEEKAAAKAAKAFFKRNRPWAVDPGLQSCHRGDDPKSSYPSGHATMAYSMAVVLAALAPEKAQALLGRAADYAESRLVCGMHFRRDIVAGQTLGTAVAIKLMQNAAFRAEYDAAAAELRSAHLR